MSRQGLAVAAAVAVLLFAQGASADVAEGTIESINQASNTFNIGNKTYQWSSLNTVGPDLRDLNEGDEVKIRYSTTHSGKNTVQRITLVKPAAAAAAAPTSAAYRPVSDDRLVNPEPQNWLLLRGNYQGWMYSPLDQINVSNVKDLAHAWSYSTGVDSWPRGAADRQRWRHVRRRPVRQADCSRMPRTATCCGSISANCRKALGRCTTPNAASRSMATRST